MQITDELMRQVLHQAFPFGDGIKDIYAEAWCLRDVSPDDYHRLVGTMVERNLIEESAEPDFYKITWRGQEFLDHREVSE